MILLYISRREIYNNGKYAIYIYLYSVQNSINEEGKHFVIRYTEECKDQFNEHYTMINEWFYKDSTFNSLHINLIP